MNLVAHFILNSDLNISDGVNELDYKSPDGTYELKLKNTIRDADIRIGSLSAYLFFREKVLTKESRIIATEKMHIALNYLAYVTNSKFKTETLRYIFDMTAGIEMRDAIVYADSPEFPDPESVLNENYMESAQRIAGMKRHSKIDSVMRWYRLGIQAENITEQFMYFWFAVEIAATATKSKVEIPHLCDKCKVGLMCKICGDTPLHPPFRTDSIEELIEKVHPEGHIEISKTLLGIRHKLMHGRTFDVALEEIKAKCNKEQAVNKMAFIAWNGIALLFESSDSDSKKPIYFGYRDNFTRRTVIASQILKTTLVNGDNEHPSVDCIPNFEAELIAVTNVQDM